MTTNTVDLERAETLQKGIEMLKETASLLRNHSDDPRVALVLPQLEGMSEGWFHPGFAEGQLPEDFLVDLLIDLLAEARGTPIEDHWRGHSMTAEEAEEQLLRLADCFELR